MSSILTNMSAMTAVQNLAATQQSLSDVQNEISTGLKISSAKDDASYWSIATNMRTQNNDLDTVTSSLNLGASVLGTASAALNNMLTVLQSIQADVIKAQSAGGDTSAIDKDIAQLQTQLKNSVSSASFNGVNLLDGTSSSGVNVVGGVTGSGASLTSSFIAVAGYNFANGSGATGIDGADTITTSGSNDNQAANLTAVGTAIANVQSAAEAIGATQKNLSTQGSFVSALSSAITTGIGSLVDADMNEASTRLNALQTQQQLGVQALSVANQNSQIILKLFQG